MNTTTEFIEYLIELLSDGIEPDVSFQYSELQYPFKECGENMGDDEGGDE